MTPYWTADEIHRLFNPRPGDVFEINGSKVTLVGHADMKSDDDD